MSLKGFIKSMIGLAIVSLVFYLLFVLFKEQVIDYLTQYPTMLALYEHMEYNITENTLLGLFYISFLGALFFVSIPVEFVAVFYFTLDYNPLLIIAVVTLGNTLGQVFDYGVGAIAGVFGKRYFEHKMGDFSHHLHKYGGWMIFFGNLVPFPIELISIALGAIHYNLGRFTLFTFLGKLGKFMGIYFFQDYITNNVIPWITNLF